MKIYTKTGDTGDTSLFGGERVRKDHARIAAYGTLDEMNAVLGMARAELARVDSAPYEGLDALLRDVQNHLFDLGAELAASDSAKAGSPLLTDEHVAELEGAIDQNEAKLPPLREFILPGGSPVAATLHLARCVCRRSERALVTLAENAPVRELPLRYVNRLSDLLFVLARVANQAAGTADTPWSKPSSD